ncbi:MAG TPA: hypothetical protein VLS48_05960, partial [Anaerolineales bacterium]|nr:hypothetical protein [Anaerolineales bacterium]
MRRRPFAFRLIGILLALVLSAPFVFPAWSQSYAFQVDRLYVDVYWNAGGTAALDYTIQFTNLPGGAPIDYIDLGLPNRHFDAEQITATVDGQPVDWISRDDYEGNGSGVALALGANAIRPGQTAIVRARVPGLRRVLYVDSTDENYASAVFAPTWFGADFVNGETDIQVTFHLPPGVQPQEPRWHAAPNGWPSQPAIGRDEQGRMTYTWRNSEARADREYPFGASFPAMYVPAEAIAQPGFWQRMGIDPEVVIVIGTAFAVIGGLMAIFASIFVASHRRQMQYLPPKISVEGHGIKRGLTAVEAAILLQQPLDKVLTLILFGALKKEALQITQKDPLEIKAHKPLMQGLKPYEIGFIAAFEIQDKTKRRAELQDVVVDLVKAVERKMKGFSRKETIDYYEDIVRRAWNQIEAAG